MVLQVAGNWGRYNRIYLYDPGNNLRSVLGSESLVHALVVCDAISSRWGHMTCPKKLIVLVKNLLITIVSISSVS